MEPMPLMPPRVAVPPPAAPTLPSNPATSEAIIPAQLVTAPTPPATWHATSRRVRAAVLRRASPDGTVPGHAPFILHPPLDDARGECWRLLRESMLPLPGEELLLLDDVAETGFRGNLPLPKG